MLRRRVPRVVTSCVNVTSLALTYASLRGSPKIAKMIEKGEIIEYRVLMKVTFILSD